MAYASLYCWKNYLGGSVHVLHIKEGVTSPVDGQRDHKLYYNLSCPFEWSKYSCAHQGQADRAMAARDYALQHSIWQYNHSFGSRQHSQERRRLLMVGDSTVRQLFIAVGCRFWLQGNAIEEYMLDWAPKNWPCQWTSNCISNGTHSGFNVGSIRMYNGNEIHYLPHSGSLQRAESNIVARWIQELNTNRSITFGTNLIMHTSPHILDRDDIVLYNVGLHNGPADNLKDELLQPATFGKSLLQQANRPTFIAMTTITQHFNTSNGQYTRTKKGLSCVPNVTINPRREVELHVWKPGENVDLIFDYDDLELGNLHINMGGTDCTHYCMPGPPDVAASRLVQVLEELRDRRAHGEG